MRFGLSATSLLIRYGRLCLLVVLALACVVQTSWGQSAHYVVEKWTSSEGLPGPEIHGLARSSDGFLWIGMDNGLVRFDGIKFKVFTQQNVAGIRSKAFSEMALGPDGHLYMANDAGLTILNREGGLRTIPTRHAQGPDEVQVVLAAGKDEAWFGTVQGHLYHYRNGEVEEVGRHKLSGDTVFGLALTRDGALWIGTSNGLFILANGTISRYRPSIPLPINGFYDLVVTDIGSLYAATDRGVLGIEGDRWQFWGVKQGLPSDNIQVLAAAPGNALWIGTTAGLARLESGDVTTIKTPPCAVGAFNVDTDDSLWIGCEHTGGLLHLKRVTAQLLSVPANISILRATSLVEDKEGVVWIATLHGLVRMQNKHFRLYTSKDGLPSDIIHALSLAPDGSLWIATADGFAHLQDGKIEAFRTQGQGPQDFVYSILEDTRGTLWVGTPRALLSRPRGQTEFRAPPRILASIWSIREDRKGNIWVSTTDKGLFRLTASSQTQFTKDCGVISNDVRDTLEDGNGDIWAATRDGLGRIRNGACATVLLGNVAEQADIDSLGSDLKGHLWLRLPNAVLAVGIADANRAIDRRGILDGTHFYGADDGFGDQLLHVPGLNSVIRHSSGEMWFATAGGVGIIDPSRADNAAPPLNPLVVSVVSDLGEHDLSQPISVKPGDLRIQVGYTAPSMDGAKSLVFRYRLTGFDKAWHPGGEEREAVYTALPPGRYTFLTSVRRPFEPWIDSSAPIEIHVLPHFYQSWWWYSLLGVAFTAVLFLGYQIRVRGIRRQFAVVLSERLQERARLARELHDTLSQGMVGIHLQIEAAQVLLDVDPSSVRKHLENVGRLALEASVETRRSIAELRSNEIEESNLHQILIKAVSGFRRSCIVSLTTEIHEDLPPFALDVVHEISRILEEALANVRIHSGAKDVTLTASVSANEFVMTVQDDGKGFKTGSIKSPSGHFGITGMNERASRISGRLQLTSHPSKGTRLTLIVPIRGRWKRIVGLRYLSSIAILSFLFPTDRG